jgi:hypothetical protein
MELPLVVHLTVPMIMIPVLAKLHKMEQEVASSGKVGDKAV